jgi:sugar phosphate isomerase/epimerase
MNYSRRDFGKAFLGGIPIATAMLSGGSMLAATGAGAQSHPPYPSLMNRRGAGCSDGDFNSRFAGVQIGAITWYSYRQMPNLTVPALLNYLIENGISGCELECGAAEPYAGAPAGAGPFGGFGGRGGRGARRPSGPPTAAERAAAQAAQKKSLEALNKWRESAPMTKFEQIRTMYNAQGVRIYGFKLEPAESWFPDSVLDYAFRVCKALGADQLTMEMPGGWQGTGSARHWVTDLAFTKRLGAIAAKYKIMVGYHAHLQATPTLWDQPMAQSPYNGINLDVGHFVAAGNRDAIAFVRKNHARITSIHLKDRHYPNIDKGSNEPWGQGDTPLKALLQLMRDQKYTFPGSIELEYAIPKNSNPVIECGRCLAWAKDVLLANGPEIAATA